MSFTLRRFLGQDMTLEGVATFDLPGARHLESFARAPMRLEFVHEFYFPTLLRLFWREYRD